MFSAIVRIVLDDVVTLTAATVLAWFINERQASDIGRRTAALLLNREILVDEGAPFLAPGAPRSTVFRSTLTTVLRDAIALAPAEGRYGAVLDGLTRRLSQMSARYVVPGRIFTGWGGDGLENLYPEVLAILAANMPERGDDEVISLVQWLAEDEVFFADADKSVQNTVNALRIFARALAEPPDLSRFERGVLALKPEAEVDDLRRRLQTILDALPVAFEAKRLERLRAAPLDPNKLRDFGEAVVAKVLQQGPEIAPFSGFSVDLQTDLDGEPHQLAVSGYDKGLFVAPSRSSMSLSQIADQCARMLRQALGQRIRVAFAGLPKTLIRIPLSGYPSLYWEAVLECAALVGGNPCLIAPYGLIGETATNWLLGRDQGRPAGLTVTFKNDDRGGLGAGYIGTVGGVSVFSAELPVGRSILCSGNALRRVLLCRTGTDGDVIATTVAAAAGDETCNVTFDFVWRAEWSADPIFEFALEAPRRRRRKPTVGSDK